MVRPEATMDRSGCSLSYVGACCTEPAGESPVRVIAGEPGSRPQAQGEILVSERGVESLPWGESNGMGRNNK
jgi:hypothetical protein